MFNELSIHYHNGLKRPRNSNGRHRYHQTSSADRQSIFSHQSRRSTATNTDSVSCSPLNQIRGGDRGGVTVIRSYPPNRTGRVVTCFFSSIDTPYMPTITLHIISFLYSRMYKIIYRIHIMRIIDFSLYCLMHALKLYPYVTIK